ncbi:MAG: hypothetical protein Unbinned4944contig1000_10 [Prokaryotic dsDNA virus sp.]|nr:MAG: hypothetical protein Unbinned4944contig1000_10 [Prokaryotic dsDNA virus sp.]
MVKVRHLASSPWPVYNGGSGCKGFAQGEVRECSEDQAEYLLGTFPGCFEKVEEKAISAAVQSPPKTTAAKAPRKRKPRAKKEKA